IRHADARRCRILIEAVGGEATVEITDDGAAVGRAGEPRAVRTGSGLAGLRTRIEHCGGVLVAGPDDAGFRLGVSVPLQPPGRGGRVPCAPAPPCPGCARAPSTAAACSWPDPTMPGSGSG